MFFIRCYSTVATECVHGSRVLAAASALARETEVSFLLSCPPDCLSFFVHISDSPHCEPPIVEEPAPDTVSVSHNSEDGA